MTQAYKNPPVTDQSTEGNEATHHSEASAPDSIRQYRNRMTHQTATAALMATITATPAAEVVALAVDVQPRDWPTADHWHIFVAAVNQARALTEAEHPDTIVSVETINRDLTAAGQLTDNARAIMLDAVGTVRGGNSLPPHSAAEQLESLKRFHMQNVFDAFADMAKTASETGSDADALALIEYAAHIPAYAHRAGVPRE